MQKLGFGSVLVGPELDQVRGESYVVWTGVTSGAAGFVAVVVEARAGGGWRRRILRVDASEKKSWF